ncbi:hypothetical protein TNCV_1576441 [Trichonephila clavipes]|nr:hypothetical protein TNCV_1576441 [Trichonephila clavipes]
MYHREKITDFVESISGFQECDAEVCGFQMLNNDEIVTSVQEESDSDDDETDEDEDNNNYLVSYIVWIAFGFRLSERCSVPIDSDKQLSTVYTQGVPKKLKRLKICTESSFTVFRNKCGVSYGSISKIHV